MGGRGKEEEGEGERRGGEERGGRGEGERERDKMGEREGGYPVVVCMVCYGVA